MKDFWCVDKVNEFRLYQVEIDAEQGYTYKIYKDGIKKAIYSFKSQEDLHNMSLEKCLDSNVYGRFLDYIDEYRDEHPEEFEVYKKPESLYDTDLFGNPIRKQKTSKRIYDYDDDDDWYSGYHGYSSGSWYHPAPEVVDENKVKELTKSNTIVFHLTDPSTTMLSQIYEGKGYDEVHSRLNNPTVAALMDAHERIICLGHGSGFGLIGMFDTAVRSHFEGKKIFTIWCNADRYFNEGHVGQGAFITGNMPSEVWECAAAGCGKISKELMLENITYWSKLCADKVEDCLAGNVRESVDYIRHEYIKKYGDHPVTHYNSVRTFVLGDTYKQAEKEVSAIEDELGIHPDWNKYNPPMKKDQPREKQDLRKLQNAELTKGLESAIRYVGTILNKGVLDLTKMVQAEGSFYKFFGEALVDELNEKYPNYEFRYFEATKTIVWNEKEKKDSKVDYIDADFKVLN